ncbi:hypothetical protein IQ270_23210 [Microcoleus sp. LEGE 07076]|uniref:hypothetical protein n=1 Tax=Microcoleus sp. LEGE 07076 TaxID=915322 RepID=UPI00187FDD86|nr:hypothetical protein [Microcoleus sp. LEGE 07076]MBE9187481.1 hypothetical protein [Microcoleus sp. LEGE 07076]
MLNLFVVSHSFDVFIMAGWNSTGWEVKVDNQQFSHLVKLRKSTSRGDREDKEDKQIRGRLKRLKNLAKRKTAVESASVQAMSVRLQTVYRIGDGGHQPPSLP